LLAARPQSAQSQYFTQIKEWDMHDTTDGMGEDEFPPYLTESLLELRDALTILHGHLQELLCTVDEHRRAEAELASLVMRLMQ
jgi:hypothetical protein